MSDCGSVCACRAASARGLGDLYAFSANAHTRALLRRVARNAGAEIDGASGMLRIGSAKVDAFVAAASGELTSLELAEVRAFRADGPLPTLEEAARAVSLATAVAQTAHADVLQMLDDESAFWSRYQPIVDLQTGGVLAHEALLRGDLDGEEIAPGRLFGAAAAADRIHVLDRIGRESALRNATGWLGDASLFVNFIPTSIYRPEVCLQTTLSAARKAGIERGQIVFEVVESYAVTDPPHLQRILDYYRAEGCRVALDDVGAGYSSLNLLAALRPDVVKIDKELVQALPGEAASAVVRAICAMSHDMGATVIAECVETPEQAEAAAELGADWGQGWLFGKPERRSPQGVMASASA